MMPMNAVAVAAGNIHSLEQVAELGYFGYDSVVLGRHIAEVSALCFSFFSGMLWNWHVFSDLLYVSRVSMPYTVHICIYIYRMTSLNFVILPKYCHQIIPVWYRYD